MCDTMAAVGSATSDGGVLFGKNSDRDYAEAQYLEWVPAARHAAGEKLRLTYKVIDQARETNGVLLSKPHWIWGGEIGANSHGLVIGNEAIFSQIAASMTEGIIGMDYLRLGLERATNVDEAIDVITALLRQYGQGGNCGFRRDIAYHNSFMIADLHNAKVLETVDREWVVASVRDYYAISNAMTIEDAFDARSTTLEARAAEAGLGLNPTSFAFKSVFEDDSMTASGEYRRHRADTLLGERNGYLQSADFFRILRDHKEGPPIDIYPGARICAHRRENPLGQTTGSWVASLGADRAVHWVTGTAAPCTGIFKPLILGAGLPVHGPKPGAKEDGASLWWRHEQLRRRLDEAEPNVRAAFTEERDALEAQFLEKMAQCPAGVGAECLDEVHRTAETCWRDALVFEFQWYTRLGANAALPTA